MRLRSNILGTSQLSKQIVPISTYHVKVPQKAQKTTCDQQDDWPAAPWDCHLPSLADPTEREFTGPNASLPALKKMRIDSP